MKLKLTTFILIATCALKVQATIHTVCNLPNSGAQYSQINDAIAASVNGDTIYVLGSYLTYNNCSIDKNIRLIGPGTYAQKETAIPATVDQIDLGPNLNGVAILGFNCRIFCGNSIQNFEIGYNQLISINNHPLWFDGYIDISNILIHSNIIIGDASGVSAAFPNIGLTNNVIIENNVFTGNLSFLHGNFVFINHNIFYNSLGNSFSDISNCIIKNNIFYNAEPQAATTSCSYYNNISYSSTATYAAMPAGNGNIDNTNPMMVNVANTGGYLPTLNFALQAGSPALNAANDGTNMGITGGDATSTVTGEVYNMPVIRKMMIQNTSVPQNGNIDVKVRSTKSRTN